MVKLVLKFAITTGVIYLIATYISGITVADTQTVLFVALAWSLITLLVRPVLKVLTFPITLITFGLFSFVLNALLFFGMTYIVPGFSVDGVIPALIGSALLSAASSVVDHLL